jgi:hypothetical protein
MTRYTNGVSTLESEPDLETPVDNGDQLTEAVMAETDHAETARLQEAEKVLVDYISALKQAPAGEHMPLLAR